MSVACFWNEPVSCRAGPEELGGDGEEGVLWGRTVQRRRFARPDRVCRPVTDRQTDGPGQSQRGMNGVGRLEREREGGLGKLSE